jgi:hypothetical protein
LRLYLVAENVIKPPFFCIDPDPDPDTDTDFQWLSTSYEKNTKTYRSAAGDRWKYGQFVLSA